MNYDWVAIFDIGDHLKKESNGLFADKEIEKFEGLTLKQKDTLVLVRRLEEEYPEGMSLKTLSNKLNLAPATVSELVENLVQQGFLTRERSLRDRRSICIKLNSVTSRQCKLSEESFTKTFNELLSELEEEEKNVFLKSLSKIHKKINLIKEQKKK